MLFDHGIETILAPLLSLHHLKRDGYMHQVAGEGLAWPASHRSYLDFYQAYDVRVRFYGDFRKHLAPTQYAHLSDSFDDIATQTAAHRRHRLFYGVFANDPISTTAELVIDYYMANGHVPDKRTVVELYYGEYIKPVSLFISFSKVRVFDMPLVTTGVTDLYSAVSPLLYLDVKNLRTILYDHLYTRRMDKSSYAELEQEDWKWMRDFYRANLGRTLGVGIQRRGIWYPLPQVKMPIELTEQY
jgi:hypothetical protein